MPTENRQRQPKFDRHITDKFQLKAQEAKPFLYPGISNIWELQPIGVTRLPICAVKFGGIKSGFTFDLDGARHVVPTFYTTSWDITSNTSKSSLIQIARGEILQIEVDIGCEVTPTGPIRAEVFIETEGNIRHFQVVNFLNPISADTRHFSSPFIWADDLMDIVFKVSTINGVAQSVNFNMISSIFPSRETSTQEGV